MKMKKTMCMLAALTMALTALPAYSYADSDTSDGGTDIQWFAEPFGYEENSDGTLTLLSTTLTDKDIVIPEEIGGKKVTGIADGAFKDLKADTLTVPDSVVTLGKKCLPENGTLIKVGMNSAAGRYLFSGFCDLSVDPATQFTYFDLTDISCASVDLPGVCSGRPPLNFEYDGTDHKEFFYDHLYNGTVKLVEGKDYTISYTDTVNVGKGYKAFNGKGAYTGVFYDPITITPASVKKTSVTVRTKCVYTGKALTPAVSVRFGESKLKEGRDYTLTYRNNTATGKAAAVVKGKGNFAEKVSKCFIIVPKQGKVADKKAPGKNRIKVQVRKDSQADGYEIQLSASKSFPENTTRSARVTGTVKTFTKLKKGKVYFIRTRSYVTVSGKKFFGKYSPVTKIRCK